MADEKDSETKQVAESEAILALCGTLVRIPEEYQQSDLD